MINLRPGSSGLFGIALSCCRSIGVVEKADRFVITLLESPMPLANAAMEGWVKALAQSPESIPA
ncbi:MULTISPECIES: DUF6858 family protein [unclassified Thiocapsa]|uniref:DUF6858 family protein n=1 Tax=unclassified Thiocapsa TaxID=2641286 RepID=UPI0035B3DDE0